MNKKIREVNIEAFRAYEEEQKFEFVHKKTGDIADLVVIYAPNGYGKTSFFDAIEWVVTDEIGRFKSTKAIKQEVDSEKGDILKNRNSNKHQGSVQIINENNCIFEKKTKKRTGNMKSDYKAGNLAPVPDEFSGIINEKATFCTTNMLAHDKITSFLHSYTAEDKSKALQVFWDTNGYSGTLEKIQSIYTEIEKSQKILSKEIRAEENDLKQYKYESNKEQNLYNLISSFNDTNTEYKIDVQNIVEDIDSILEKTDLILKKIQFAKNNNELSVNTIDLLINDYPDYILNNNKLREYRNDKKMLERKKELLNIVEGLYKQKKILQSKRDEYLVIINNWEIFVNAEKEIAEKSIRKETIEKNKVVLKKKLVQIRETISKSNEHIAEADIQKETEIKKKKNVEIEFDKYNENKSNLEKYSNLIIKESELLSQSINKRSLVSDEISNIESYIENKCSEEQIKDFVSTTILELIFKVESLKKVKLEQEKIVHYLEENYNNTVALQEKINQLLIQGKELIESTNVSECPLCHAKYDDYTSLISQVNAVYQGNIQLENIQSEIEENKKVYALTIGDLASVKDELQKELLGILDVKKSEFKKQNDNIHKYQIQINDWNNLIVNLRRENDLIQKSYESINFDIQNTETINLLKSKIDEKIISISQNIESYKSKVATNQEEVKNLEINLRQDEINSIELDGRITQLKNNEMYNTILLFLKNQSIHINNDDFQKILNGIVVIENKLQQDIILCESQIINSQNEVNDTSEAVESQYAVILQKSQEISVITDEYRLRLKNIFGDEAIQESRELKMLEKQKQDIENSNMNLNRNILLLQSIISNSNGLKEQKNWISRKKEYDRKVTKCDMIKAKKEKLEISKKIVEEYIVKETNSYFNSDTINHIYHKIDPHPTMNHIKFITERSDKGMQTHIYTYDESEEDKMSPVLYLSSAQVNILSLCIFLGKVLTEKNTTLNTIFMDDPIQHLDGINLLAFIDLLRTITTTMGRQIVISTHNEHFYNLIKVKMDDEYYLSRFIELNSVGVIDKNVI
ncbi:MAG: AAA family ATPase [Eubacteriales bacterium]